MFARSNIAKQYHTNPHGVSVFEQVKEPKILERSQVPQSVSLQRRVGRHVAKASENESQGSLSKEFRIEHFERVSQKDERKSSVIK